MAEDNAVKDEIDSNRLDPFLHKQQIDFLLKNGILQRIEKDRKRLGPQSDSNLRYITAGK